MSQRRREFKEKWDTDMGSLRVYPKKTTYG